MKVLLAAGALALFAAGCRNETAERVPVEEVPVLPERIVSLAPHLTESLLAVGLGRARLVGAVDGGPSIAGGPEPVRLGDPSDPDLVALLTLDPDLVLTPPSPTIEQFLSVHGIRYEVLPAVEILDPIRSLRRIGRAIGRDEAAGRIEDQMVRRLLALKDRLASAAPVPVALATGRRPAIFVGAHPYLRAVIEYAGGENVLASELRPYVELEPSRLAQIRPRVLIDATDALEGVAADPREARWWEDEAHLMASGIGLTFLASDAVFSPGPRMVEGIEELAAILHPEVVAGK